MYNENWSDVLNSNDTNFSFNSFLTTYLKHFNQNCPNKTKTIKKKSIVNQWMTASLIKSSKRKQSLYNKFLKNRTTANETNYKNYKKLFQKLVINAKKEYYSQKLIRYSSSLKKTWSLINEICGKRKYENSFFPRTIKINNNIIKNKKDICIEFNKFFVNVGPNLASKIDAPSVTFDYFLNDATNSNYEFKELSLEEFDNAFINLKRKSSYGHDEISSNVIFYSIDSIRKPLFHVLNLSLQNSIFPEELKIAKVNPIFKKGDKSNTSNYRPISLLTSFSKIFERVIYNRLYSYLIANNILYKKQFGFQNNTSTEHAILDFTHSIFSNFDKNYFTLGIFMDLSKAFDTVDHDILISKLSYYGIKGNLNKLIKDYLTNRKQYVIDKSNGLLDIYCGVPQGSILGPLLFLIYVNDLYKASNKLNCIMFADDTTLSLASNNINELFTRMNEELGHISIWLKANKLSLNTDKTKYILFHKTRQSDNLPLKLPDLTINSSKIEQCSSIKFLGVIIDENLSWKQHIEYLECKISRVIGIIYKSRYYLNKSCLKSIYFALVHSHLSYANIAWGSNTNERLKKLISLQKHAVRAVCFKKRYEQSAPLMKTLNILSIPKINEHQHLLLMHKSFHGKLPINFNVIFVQANELNTKYNLRSLYSNNFILPKRKSKHTDLSISYRGPKVWNELKSDELKLIENFNSFKLKSKKHLLENV